MNVGNNDCLLVNHVAGDVTFDKVTNKANYHGSTYYGPFMGGYLEKIKGYTEYGKVSFIDCKNEGNLSGVNVGIFFGNASQISSWEGETADHFAVKNFVNTGKLTGTHIGIGASNSTTEIEDKLKTVYENNVTGLDAAHMTEKSVDISGVTASKVAGTNDISLANTTVTGVDHYELKLSVPFISYPSATTTVSNGNFTSEQYGLTTVNADGTSSLKYLACTFNESVSAEWDIVKVSGVEYYGFKRSAGGASYCKFAADQTKTTALPKVSIYAYDSDGVVVGYKTIDSL
jgi:hypothetical protein